MVENVCDIRHESELREEGPGGVVGNGGMCVAYTKIVVKKNLCEVH